jgi:glycerol uptake facilitator-like aquaporin
MDANMNKVLCEFLGTFVFLFTILQSGRFADASGSPGLAPWVVAAGLLVAIFMFLPFGSGAHFNPAVSVMMWANNDPTVGNLPNLGKWVGAQCLGALAAYWVHKKLVGYSQLTM